MPHHEHDCKTCTYLGSYSTRLSINETHTYDLYAHTGDALGTSLIARYGIDGDYLSTPLAIYTAEHTISGPLLAALVAYVKHLENKG